MSFLDVLESIGTGKRVAAPQAQPSSYSILKPSVHVSNPTTGTLNQRVPAQPVNDTPSMANGTKRKAESTNKTALETPLKPSLKEGSSSTTTEKKVSAKASLQAATRNTHSRVSIPASAATPNKIPPPGSYAALMANAKAAQEQRAKSEVGLIKHQATSKERLSKSEKRKREEGEKAIRSKLGKQALHNSKVHKKPRLDVKTRPESSYKGTAKPATPVSSYRGTAGLPSQHRPSSADARYKSGKKTSRLDDYLATDEEDEGDEIVGVVDDEYGSDASSDMEADAFAVEEEENRALQQARADDAREMALENRLKREKEERRRKLEALARKRTSK